MTSFDAAFPILEHDPSPTAIIEPSRVFARMDVAEHCVLCFFQDAIDALVASANARVVRHFKSEMGPHPVYELTMGNRRVVLYHPRVGAPLAAASLDALVALGCRKFIACGGCGVLDGSLVAGHLIVPISAVRDEGTSYHYMPPSRELAPSAEGVEAIEATLKAHDCDYVLAKTWSTDAYFRETTAKVARRKAEGCLTVEMEASAFFAVAAFRGVTFAQILYAGDDLSGAEWDTRAWDSRADVRRRLLELSIEACLRM